MMVSRGSVKIDERLGARSRGSQHGPQLTIGIVGGGISGLATHHYLQREGIESVVFEADPSAGGVIRTIERAGRILECGPQRTRLTPPIEALIKTIGIADGLIEAANVPLYVYYDGALRSSPLSARTALTTQLFSWRGKARVLFEPIAGSSPKHGETVEQYLTRAFGKEFAERFAGPLFAGLYGSDPADMPVQHSLLKAFDRFGIPGSVLGWVVRNRIRGQSPPPVITLRDGMQSLPRAMVDTYADSVQLDTPVTGIVSNESRYEIRTIEESVRVDEVVLGTPAWICADLLEDVETVNAQPLRELSYNPLAIVHLRAETDLVGSGYQVVSDQFVTRGVTWNDSLFDDGEDATKREDIYTAFLGDAPNHGGIDWDETRLGETAAQEFERITGYDAEPIHVDKQPRAMPAYDASWDGLEDLELPETIHVCGNYIERPGLPGRIVHARRIADRIAQRANSLG